METEEEDKNRLKDLRREIVSKILEKSVFANITGKTIVDYSKSIEDYIENGIELVQGKTGNNFY